MLMENWRSSCPEQGSPLPVPPVPFQDDLGTHKHPKEQRPSNCNTAQESYSCYKSGIRFLKELLWRVILMAWLWWLSHERQVLMIHTTRTGWGKSRFTVVGMRNTVYSCVIIYHIIFPYKQIQTYFAPPHIAFREYGKLPKHYCIHLLPVRLLASSPPTQRCFTQGASHADESWDPASGSICCRAEYCELSTQNPLFYSRELRTQF